MTENIRETMSAYMDGEANELELQRFLKNIDEDPELRAAYVRYELARGALSGTQLTHANVDISGGVKAAIARERVAGTPARSGEKLLKPLASFAVAASVAAIVVLGGQELAQVDQGAAASPLAVNSGSPAPVIPHTGSIVDASFPLPSLEPVDSGAYEDLARQRLGKYLQVHAEQASLNSPQGLIPYARVPDIRR
ncbi:MAG: RseA family anti-sigma factor [Pseudomonadota bacterium]